MPTGYERRLERIEEAVQERTRQPAYTAEYIEQFMLGKDTGKDDTDSGSAENRGEAPSCLPDFWIHPKHRWQHDFIAAFGAPVQVIEGDKISLFWPEYRPSGDRPEFSPMP